MPNPLLLRRVILAQRDDGALISDTFTRADSALTLGNTETGQVWTANSGTWGISGNKAYTPSETALGNATVDSEIVSYTYDVTIRGDFTDASNYSLPCVVFRYIDGNNFLLLEPLNGNLRLYKKDAGSFSQLAIAAQTLDTDTDYLVHISAVANAISISVDDVAKISHTLSGGNTKYSGSTATHLGFLFQKAGTPTSAARWDTLEVNAA